MTKRAEQSINRRTRNLIFIALTLGGGSSAWAKGACAERLAGEGKISGIPFSVVNAHGSLQLPPAEAGKAIVLGKTGFVLALAPNLRSLKVLIAAEKKDAPPTALNLIKSEGIAGVTTYLGSDGTLTVAILDRLDEMVSVYRIHAKAPAPAKSDKAPTQIEELGALEVPRSVGFGAVTPLVQFDARGLLMIAHRNGYMFMNVSNKNELFHSSTKLMLRTHTQAPRAMADGSVILSDGQGNYQVLNVNFAEAYAVSLGEKPELEAVMEGGEVFVAKGANKSLAINGQEHILK